jgi:glyoxylase-like metal-dependent hydrolase (beta-lactamase superfamily II)
MAADAMAADTPASPSDDSVFQDGPPIQIRPNIYLLTRGGRNIVLQLGEDGAIVVDTGAPGAGDKVVQDIHSLTKLPVLYIINTSADLDSVGNNATVAAAGAPVGSETVGVGVADTLGFDRHATAPITAYQNVINTMLSPGFKGLQNPSDSLPGDFYDSPQRQIYLNGGPIYVMWQPAAHSDGDSVVAFRRDDVLVTGSIFDMSRFPVIDLDHGGSIQGEINAINNLLDTQVDDSVPLTWREGQRYGTLVIPARGEICEQADLVQYRDMLQIIRDRVDYYIKQRKTLDQVVALHPAEGYAARFGATSGPWTTDMFVTAVYKSLKAGNAGMKHGRGGENQ